MSIVERRVAGDRISYAWSLTILGGNVSKPQSFLHGDPVCQVARRQKREEAPDVRFLVNPFPPLLRPHRGRERHQLLVDIQRTTSFGVDGVPRDGFLRLYVGVSSRGAYLSTFLGFAVELFLGGSRSLHDFYMTCTAYILTPWTSVRDRSEILAKALFSWSVNTGHFYLYFSCLWVLTAVFAATNEVDLPNRVYLVGLKRRRVKYIYHNDSPLMKQFIASSICIFHLFSSSQRFQNEDGIWNQPLVPCCCISTSHL